MKARAHVFFSGRVQGVFFRSNTRSMASVRKVTGWVKNLPDGRVEAIMEGQREDIEALIEACKEGRTGSVVDDVQITWENATGSFDSFEIAV